MNGTPVKNGRERNGGKKPACLQRVLALSGWILLGCALVLAGTLAAVSIRPSLGAQGADLLRGVIGDPAVARLEMEVYQLQDTLQKWKYNLGWAPPYAPWGNTPFPRSVPTPTRTPLPLLAAAIPTTPAVTQEPAPVATATPVPVNWPPAALTPLGSLAGEGAWGRPGQRGGYAGRLGSLGSRLRAARG